MINETRAERDEHGRKRLCIGERYATGVSCARSYLSRCLSYIYLLTNQTDWETFFTWNILTKFWKTELKTITFLEKWYSGTTWKYTWKLKASLRAPNMKGTSSWHSNISRNHCCMSKTRWNLVGTKVEDPLWSRSSVQQGLLVTLVEEISRWWGLASGLQKPGNRYIRVRAWTIQKRRGWIVLDEDERKEREATMATTAK